MLPTVGASVSLHVKSEGAGVNQRQSADLFTHISPAAQAEGCVEVGVQL